MAAFDYLDARNVADGLIDDFGRAGIIRRLTPGAGPSHNPGSPTPTDYACTLVVTQFAKREIDGTLIRSTDKKVLVAAGNLEIEPVTTTDQLVIDGEAFTIVPPVNVLKPANTVVLWTLQCRLAGRVPAASGYEASFDFSVSANSQYLVFLEDI